MNIILLQAAGQGDSSWRLILMMVLIFGVMYLLMIRPQQKRQKELNKFRDSLKKGDKVITAGGIYAVVKSIEDNTVLVEVDSNVTLRIDKSMIMKDSSDIAQK